LVKLKILKHVGQWGPGTIVEVDDKLAEQLLIANEVHNGHKFIINRRAMKLEEAEALENLPHDINELTAYEASQLGIKNITDNTQQPEDQKAEVKKTLTKSAPKRK